jgi:RNA polymerase sigma factor (sigma-70 family)
VSSLEQHCELPSRLDAGDEDRLEPAFESFYGEHYAFIWRSARRMLIGADEGLIEDVIQDTWITAYRRFDSFAGACRPTTWLFGILRNIVRNHSRGERRRARRISALAESERERARERNDAPLLLARTLLDDFLGTLDADKRAVFVLAELEGQSGREIAEALGVNVNTVHSRLRAARRQFCAHFELPPAREPIAAQLRPLREQPERPDAQASARSRALLIAGLGKGGWLATGGGTVGLAVLGHGVVGKLAAVAGALLIAGVGVWASERDSSDDEIVAAAVHEPAIRERAASESPKLSATEPSEPATEAEADPILVPAASPIRPTKPAVDVYETVRQARAALVADQPAQALELLARIPASSSSLRAERAATEIAALCRLGRGAQARAVAEVLAAVEPDSPLLARVDSACW